MTRWALAIAIGFAIAWMAYARSGTGASRTRVWALAALRAVACALIAALIVGAPSAPPRPAPPVVAIDASASARRAGGDDSTTVRALRTAWQTASTQYGAGTDDVVLFGDSLREISRSAIDREVPRDVSSRVRPAVDRAAALGRPLLVLTDGELEDAEALVEAPLGSRVVLMPRESKRDAALADLTIPASASGGDTVQVAATIMSGAAGAPEGQLRVSVDGAAPTSAAIPALGAYASTRITVPLPLARGARTATVSAHVEVAGDVELRNDTLRATLDIEDRPAAVFVSTAPDLDVREALVVLRGALAIRTRAYLRLAPGVWREEGTLAPISENDVRARAGAAGLLIVHGDTTWAPAGSGRRAARALWSPAPPTALARAGENTRAAEWYASSAPPSPLSSALAGLPWDSLPPLTIAGVPRGAITVLTAKLGKQGDAVAAIVAREDAGMRTLVISGSGYAGWALRGGRSAEAFAALWGSIFDWLALGRGDMRAARPAQAWARAGDPIAWRRGGADSIVTAVMSARAGTNAAISSDTVIMRFTSGAVETTTPPLSAGVYDVRTAGGTSVLVVNPSREWIPRAPSAKDGVLSVGALSSDAPRLSDHWWPFVAILVLLSCEWIGRRAAGLR